MTGYGAMFGMLAALMAVGALAMLASAQGQGESLYFGPNGLIKTAPNTQTFSKQTALPKAGTVPRLPASITHRTGAAGHLNTQLHAAKLNGQAMSTGVTELLNNLSHGVRPTSASGQQDADVNAAVKRLNQLNLPVVPGLDRMQRALPQTFKQIQQNNKLFDQMLNQ